MRCAGHVARIGGRGMHILYFLSPFSGLERQTRILEVAASKALLSRLKVFVDFPTTLKRMQGTP
jgi:hypothetical protein